MAKLRIVDGPLAGTEFVLQDGPSVAGRHADCAILIPDPKVSRNHAEFIADGNDQYSIIDVGSSNGTLVNGIPIPPSTPRLLTGGDEIHMGQHTLRYFAGDARIPDLDIPGFILEDILAEGGMGSIFQARNRETGLPAAIKILHPDYAGDEEFVGRFIQEARAAGRLSHPNIIKVYHVGKTAGGQYYFTMELVRGATLTQKIPCLTVEEGALMLLQIADALAYAHKRGIIHRDVKPDNILIGADGEPKLTDLGIAVLDQQVMEQTGSRVLGTPHYMSPEQASGKNLTASTDIYSLGATFFHVFAGEPVFDAPDPQAVMVKHVRENPRPLIEVSPDVPLDLAAIIDRCLEKKAARRHPDMAALHAAIEESLRRAFPGFVPQPRRKGVRRAGVVLSVAALILLVLFAAFLLFIL